jgi:hypothetical protein
MYIFLTPHTQHRIRDHYLEHYKAIKKIFSEIVSNRIYTIQFYCRNSLATVQALLMIGLQIGALSLNSKLTWAFSQGKLQRESQGDTGSNKTIQLTPSHRQPTGPPCQGPMDA